MKADVPPGSVVVTDRGPALLIGYVPRGGRTRAVVVFADLSRREISLRRIRRRTGETVTLGEGWEEGWARLAPALRAEWEADKERKREEAAKADAEIRRLIEEFERGGTVCPRCRGRLDLVLDGAGWQEFVCCSCRMGWVRGEGVRAVRIDLTARALDRELDRWRAEWQREMSDAPAWRKGEVGTFEEFLRRVLRPGALKQALIARARRGKGGSA